MLLMEKAEDSWKNVICDKHGHRTERCYTAQHNDYENGVGGQTDEPLRWLPGGHRHRRSTDKDSCMSGNGIATNIANGMRTPSRRGTKAEQNIHFIFMAMPSINVDRGALDVAYLAPLRIQNSSPAMFLVIDC